MYLIKMEKNMNINIFVTNLELIDLYLNKKMSR